VRSIFARNRMMHARNEVGAPTVPPNGRNRVRVVSGTPITDAQRVLNEANAD